MQYKLVQRRRNAVETDKDVMRCGRILNMFQKIFSEDVSEEGRSKDSVESGKQRHRHSTNAVQT